MTTTTMTVDALLRARSDANLSAELDSLLAPILALLSKGNNPEAAPALVAAFKAQCVTALAVPRQQAEIDAFLAHVTTQQFVDAS